MDAYADQQIGGKVGTVDFFVGTEVRCKLPWTGRFQMSAWAHLRVFAVAYMNDADPETVSYIL